jgi:hypothetical protein
LHSVVVGLSCHLERHEELVNIFKLEPQWLAAGGEPIHPIPTGAAMRTEKVEIGMRTFGGGRGLVDLEKVFGVFGEAWRKGVAQIWVDGEEVDWEADREENGRKVCALRERVDRGGYDRAVSRISSAKRVLITCRMWN